MQSIQESPLLSNIQHCSREKIWDLVSPVTHRELEIISYEIVPLNSLHTFFLYHKSNYLIGNLVPYIVSY